MQPSRRFGSLSSNASAPGRTTRYIYAPQFHWKILLPLEEPRHVHRFTRDATHPTRPIVVAVVVVIVAWGASGGAASTSPAVTETLENGSVYFMPAARATEMLVRTLYSFIFFPPRNEPAFRAREILGILNIRSTGDLIFISPRIRATWKSINESTMMMNESSLTGKLLFSIIVVILFLRWKI